MVHLKHKVSTLVTEENGVGVGVGVVVVAFYAKQTNKNMDFSVGWFFGGWAEGMQIFVIEKETTLQKSKIGDF